MNSVFSNLKVGSLVEIELMNMQDKKIVLKSIVEEIISDTELKIFAPILKGSNYPLRIKQKLSLVTVIKYPKINNYDIFVCDCEVVNKGKEDNISTITLLRTSNFTKTQRRNYFRLPLIKNMTVIFDDVEYELLSKDLSGNGVRGYLSKKIPATTEGQLIFTTENNVEIKVDLKVIDCNTDSNDTFRYDLRASFINLSNSQMSKIMRYIFFKQSEAIKKQLDFNDYNSILDTDQSYSDFFSMNNVEKLIRISPIALWSIVLIEYAYFMMAFRDRNMGINFFFNQTKSKFRPEFLVTANSFAYIVIFLATSMLIFSYFYNKKKHIKTSISLILQIILSIIVIVVYQLYKNGLSF